MSHRKQCKMHESSNSPDGPHLCLNFYSAPCQEYDIMTDETTITSNTNAGDTDKLNPTSETPWTSNPDETKEPVLSLTWPDEKTITEVTLVNPDNVDSYTVVVTDEEGNSQTVSEFVFDL